MPLLLTRRHAATPPALLSTQARHHPSPFDAQAGSTPFTVHAAPRPVRTLICRAGWPRWLALLALTGALSACAVTPPPRPQPASATPAAPSSPAVPTPSPVGQPPAAAVPAVDDVQARWRLLASLPPEQAGPAQLGLLEQLYDQQQTERALTLLAGWPQRAAMRLREPARSQFLDALDLAAQGRTQEAEALLRLMPTPMAPELAARQQQLLLDLAMQTGDAARAIRLAAAAARPAEQRGSQQLQHAQQRLWALLEQTDTARLTQLRTEATQSGDADLQGWIDLALALREPPAAGETADARLWRWAERHPVHPAHQSLINELMSELTRPNAPATLFEAGNPPATGLPPSVLSPQGATETALSSPVAPVPSLAAGHATVLLPAQGPLVPYADAIRAGLEFARQQASQGPVLKFQAQGADAPATLSAYQAAVAEAASLIIGPLGTEANSQLAASLFHGPQTEGPATVTPTLLLSDTVTVPPGPVWRFALSPESDLEAVLAFGATQGYQRWLLLVPDTEAGQRATAAANALAPLFAASIVDSGRYDPAASDHRAMLRALLNFNASAAPRASDPRSGLTPRRTDVDAILMVADPNAGRALKPQLFFLFAGNLPTLATPQVFSGRLNPGADRDLDGTLFAEAPWVLAQVLQTQPELLPGLGVLPVSPADPTLPEAARSRPRLFAYGYDLHLLAAAALQGQLQPGATFNGLTGRLQVLPDGRIQRQPVWVRMHNGRPEPLATGSAAVQTLTAEGMANPPTSPAGLAPSTERAAPVMTPAPALAQP